MKFGQTFVVVVSTIVLAATGYLLLARSSKKQTLPSPFPDKESVQFFRSDDKDVPRPYDDLPDGNEDSAETDDRL